VLPPRVELKSRSAVTLATGRLDLEGQRAAVGVDRRAHVEDDALEEHVDLRVGDRLELRDLDVEVLDVGRWLITCT
jgi:hypothetical protein